MIQRCVINSLVSFSPLNTYCVCLDTINNIALPEDDSNDYLGETSWVSGWGLTSENANSISEVLNELSSHIMSNYACRLAYFGYVEDTNICMASYVGKATCSGDSGGALVVDGVQVSDNTKFLVH